MSSEIADAIASNARLKRPSSSVPLRWLRASQVAGGDLLGGMHQPRGAARQQEVERQPHRQRQRGHPSRPVERLLDHLRACFRLVALEVVGKEQAAGARRPQLVARAPDEDARVAEKLFAGGIDGHAAAALADRSRGLVDVELGQHVGDLLVEPRAPRRGDDDATLVGERGEHDVVVVREHRDLVLGGDEIALEQQVLQRALQARHLLRHALASVVLGRALGLRDVIEQVDRAQYRGEPQQHERDRELERHRHAQGHRGRPTKER